MSSAAIPSSRPRIIYPDTDGRPMAENTIRFRWIVTITGGLEATFGSDPNVFVAGDLFWYPVQGHPEICIAPDAMVVFGRPKGDRLSYLQWEEGGIAPQVVFEVLSPSNRRPGEMLRKLEFYQRYGVEEYYLYDPGPGPFELSGFIREGDRLVEIRSMQGHISPRLGVRFEMEQDGLHLFRPDGQPFLPFEEVVNREEFQRHRADQESARADREHARAEEERARAERERALAEEQRLMAERERRRAEEAMSEVERLRERLRSSGQHPD